MSCFGTSAQLWQFAWFFIFKTFAKTAKSATLTGKTKKSKEILAERNVFGQLVLLAVESDIDLQRVLSFPLGPMPWPLSTADGTPVKTDKAKLLHLLAKDVQTAERPSRDSNIYIIDGNAMYQAQTNIPDNFGGLAETLFDQFPKEARVDFVTDSYYPYSVKGLERSRRGSGTVHLIKGSSTKVPRNRKTFLSNDENKQNLTKFLLDEWKQDKYATKLKGRQIMFVCGDHCTCLLSADGLTTLSESVEELCSTQEEADTKIDLHCLIASKVL